MQTSNILLLDPFSRQPVYFAPQKAEEDPSSHSRVKDFATKVLQRIKERWRSDLVFAAIFPVAFVGFSIDFPLITIIAISILFWGSFGIWLMIEDPVLQKRKQQEDKIDALEKKGWGESRHVLKQLLLYQEISENFFRWDSKYECNIGSTFPLPGEVNYIFLEQIFAWAAKLQEQSALVRNLKISSIEVANIKRKVANAEAKLNKMIPYLETYLDLTKRSNDVGSLEKDEMGKILRSVHGNLKVMRALDIRDFFI